MNERIAKTPVGPATCSGFAIALSVVGLFVNARDGMSKPARERVAREAAPALARAIASIASDGAPLALDPSLDQVAMRHAALVLVSPENATHEKLATAFVAEGLADARIVPFATVGRSRDALVREAERFVSETARSRKMTHVGVGVATRARELAMVVVFVRRLVELAPLAGRVGAAGVVVRGASPHPIEAILERPASPSRRDLGVPFARTFAPLDVRRKGHFLEIAVPADHGSGPYVFEIVATTELGPEVAALWTFHVGAGRSDAFEAMPPTQPGEGDDAWLERSIADARKRRALLPLARAASLDAAALAHARAVCDSMLAVHVLPGGEDPAERARRSGFFGAVTENVAIARNAEHAARNFFASPSHARNTFDRDIQYLGVGVAHRARREGDEAVCVVELFGHDE